MRGLTTAHPAVFTKKVLGGPLPWDASALLTAALWLAVGVVSAMLAAQSPHMTIAGAAWCLDGPNTWASLLTAGHCPWCYSALAGFALSAWSLRPSQR